MQGGAIINGRNVFPSGKCEMISARIAQDGSLRPNPGEVFLCDPHRAGTQVRCSSAGGQMA
jgi:hypothetical protein